MKKTKAAAAIVLAVIVCALCSFGVVGAEETGEAQPFGLTATVTVGIDGSGDGRVIATATNVFTLGPSTVRVILSLYRADEYTTDTSEMVLMAQGQSPDLDMWHSISAFAYTGGTDGYWMAVLEYSLDGGEYIEKSTSCVHYDADGNKI